MGTVLVTGAEGFVGGHLLNSLAATHPIGTTVAWRRPESSAAADGPPPHVQFDDRSVRWEEVDILDRARVARAIADLSPSQIYHCAGSANVHGSWTNTAAPFEVNVRGTQFLLEAVAEAHLSTRILIPGSALVYKPSAQAIAEDDPLGPVSPYGVSKLAQEMLGRRCADEGLAVLVTRSFTHLGPGQAPSYAVSSFANQIAQIEAGMSPPVINVGSLDARRDLTDVRDTVRAYLDLMSRGQTGRPYNVCSGRSHRIGDVLDGLLHHANVNITVQSDPTRLRPRDNDLLLGNPSRMATEIGWHPRVPLETTLGDILNYWRRVTRAQT